MGEVKNELCPAMYDTEFSWLHVSPVWAVWRIWKILDEYVDYICAKV